MGVIEQRLARVVHESRGHQSEQPCGGCIELADDLTDANVGFLPTASVGTRRLADIAETCRVCGHQPVQRFTMNVRRGQTTRGAGRTFLCHSCWERLILGSPRRGGSPEK